MLRPIITVPDPRLKQISKPVETVNKDIQRLMDDMLESMYHAQGIGLAAIQVAVPLRIVVMDLSGPDERTEPRYFVNPEVVTTSSTKVPYQEGCLSLPGVFEDVNRPDFCRLRFLDYHGRPQDIQCDGLLATCIQHEIDHLNGIVFVERLSRLKRGMVLKKYLKNHRSPVPA